MDLANKLYNKYYQIFKDEHVLDGGIVFLGDSIINYYPLDKYFNNNNLVNRGIPGDTTKGVLARLDQIYQIKPKIVILSIGSNDISRYNDHAETIVKRILEIKYLLENNIEFVKVYLLSIIPILKNHKISDNKYIKNKNNDIINEINEELLIHTKLIDTNSCLKDESENLRVEYTLDGLHLTNKGYQKLSQRLSSEIIELKLKE